LPIKKPTRDHSGSFDVQRYSDFRTRWYPEGTPGAYHSTATGVHDYFNTLARIKAESQRRQRDSDGNICFGETSVKLLLWGLCYDFMSFCARYYGNNLEARGESISKSRHNLVNYLMAYPEHAFQYNDIRRCIISIAATCKGQPSHATDIKCYESSGDESDNRESEDESDSESDTEYNEAPVNEKRKCARMSVYGCNDKKMSSQRKYQFQSYDSIKLEKKQRNNNYK
jgi:hypothetical protein